jgi:hypothetical protein
LFVARCFEAGKLGTCGLEPVPEKVAAIRISLEMTIEKPMQAIENTQI